MRFRRRQKHEVGIDLTALIDVVFLLLIFFMVSTTFIRTHVQVELPEASGEPQRLEDEVVEVAIAADGTYAVNDRMLADSRLGTLMRALQDATDGESARHLVITADAKATHQSVVRAMDAAAQLGLVRLSITTREPDEEP